MYGHRIQPRDNNTDRHVEVIASVRYDYGKRVCDTCDVLGECRKKVMLQMFAGSIDDDCFAKSECNGRGVYHRGESKTRRAAKARLLTALAGHPYSTAEEIANLIETSYSGTKTYLREMMDAGLVSKRTEGKPGPGNSALWYVTQTDERLPFDDWPMRGVDKEQEE
jgi:hypothetical protein